MPHAVLDKPLWKSLYSIIETAVISLDSVDSLLKQTVAALTDTYQTDCLLWINLESGVSELTKVYSSRAAIARVYAGLPQREASLAFRPVATADSIDNAAVAAYYPEFSPLWLEQQRQQVGMMQRDLALIVPIWSQERLRLVFQLERFQPARAEQGQSEPLQSQQSQAEWTQAEMDALEIVGSQLVLALDALYWRQRLEQSRHQAALVGRIVRLLNSSLNPSEVMERIVAELGQGLGSDRTILIDLQRDPGQILAVWDKPTDGLQPLEQLHMEHRLWLNELNLFLQEAASYLEIGIHDNSLLGEWLQRMGAAAALVMPLFVQQEFFGAVLLLSRQADRVYGLDELRTVRQVADQAAVALTNAQHYQLLWSRQELLRRQNSTLQLEASHDPLTQLLNRRSLEQELERLSNPTPIKLQNPYSIIVCDIDHFKMINDSYGHLIGDEVLQIVAQRLQKQLRGGMSSAYRYGGEEFVVVLTTISLARAIEVAERLRAAIGSTQLRTNSGLLRVTASFGVAQKHPDQDQNAWSVVQRADQALYEAKRQGRNRVVGLSVGETSA